MSEIEMKRSYVADLYPGPRWKEKVRKMPDAQIIAIYLRETSKPKNNPKESGSGGTGGDDIPF